MDVRIVVAGIHVLLFPMVSSWLREHRPGTAAPVAVLGLGAGLAMTVDAVRARRIGLALATSAFGEGVTAAGRAAARGRRGRSRP